MRIHWESDRPWDLWAAGALVALAGLAVLLGAPAWLRVPLGLAFVLAAPGYALVAALFPERHRPAQGPAEGQAVGRRGLAPLERAALSLGLSIAVVPLLGLALNYTPWGIRLAPVLLACSAFTLACLGVAAARRARLPADERLHLRLHHDSAPWSERAPLDRALSAGLALAVVFAAGSLAYVLANPRPAEAFTELYLLGPTGKAACYPAHWRDGAYRVSDADAQAGCPLTGGTVTIGVVNHEGRDVDYRLRVVWTQEERRPDNTTRVLAAREVRTAALHLPSVPVDLSLNASFRPQHEEPFALPPPPFNGTLRLSVQLYLGEPPPVTVDEAFLDTPHRRVHLWIDVPPVP